MGGGAEGSNDHYENADEDDWEHDRQDQRDGVAAQLPQFLCGNCKRVANECVPQVTNLSRKLRSSTKASANETIMDPIKYSRSKVRESKGLPSSIVRLNASNA